MAEETNRGTAATQKKKRIKENGRRLLRKNSSNKTKRRKRQYFFQRQLIKHSERQLQDLQRIAAPESEEEDLQAPKLESRASDGLSLIIPGLTQHNTSTSAPVRKRYGEKTAGPRGNARSRLRTKAGSPRNKQSNTANREYDARRQVTPRFSHSRINADLYGPSGKDRGLDMARKKAVKRHGLRYAAKHTFSQESLGDRMKTALKKEFTGSASGEGLLIVLFAPVLLFMMIGALFSGEGTTPFPHLPVSEEVEMYSPIIRYYAFEFEIPEFTELIKAVMMQESRGLGSDPMQCSESPYNLKYPNTPGGITDPEYSVEVGIQSLADVLEWAGVNDPMDLDGISLALQGYNFGSGYIDWAMENYGGYTEENAAEYAGKMAAQMGWAEYGDPEYVRHVMRYYCFEDGWRTVKSGNR